MLPAAREAWFAQAANLVNASSLHASVRATRRVVEESRESMVSQLGVRPSAIVFTSGGTEADNLAVKGLFWARRESSGASRILASAIEHHAVLDPVEWLASHQGADARWLRIDHVGRLRIDDLVEQLERSAQVP